MTKVKYGDESTYTYKLSKYFLNYITDRTNRSNRQTQYLFNLVGGSIQTLVELEKAIKKHHITHCPDSLEYINEILSR